MLASSAIWAFVALAGLDSVYLSRRTPEWYGRQNVNPEQQAAAANTSDQTIADLVSFANDLGAAMRRHQRTGEAISIGPKTIILTDDQINAFLDKWEHSLRDEGIGLDQYLTGLRVEFLDGRILIAGTIQNESVISDTVISAELGLLLDDQGQIRPSVIRFYDGRLPLPRVLLASPEKQLRERLQWNIENWRRQQHVWPDGLADDNAAAALWASILVAALDGKTVDSVLLLPCDFHSVPVRVTALEVVAGEIRFTLAPIEAQGLIPGLVGRQ
jgi:hypothetical protein